MTDYEWDDDKADTNWRDHKVTFQQAIKALEDHFLVEWIDDREELWRRTHELAWHV